MSSIRDRVALDSLTSLHWVGIALALVSATVHLVMGIGFLPHWMGVLFVLAAAGFVGAVVLLCLDYHRRLLYLIGIPFTASQILGWYVVNRPAEIADISPVEAVDKIAQLALIVLLIRLYTRRP